ncbi:MAG: hypothetical protein WC498_02900 [Candidatus Saccharimonadales bacterium]
MEDKLEHNTVPNTLDVDPSRLPKETITLEQYRAIGHVPIAEQAQLPKVDPDEVVRDKITPYIH